MNPDSHYRSLEKMYLSAPINAFFRPKIAISREYAQILADSVVFDGRGREIGRGNGLFVRGKNRLSEVRGYGDKGAQLLIGKRKRTAPCSLRT